MKGVILGIAIAVATTACSEGPKTFDTNVEIVRLRPIRRDEQKAILTIDIEVSYFECPGEQRKVFRGDKEFAACMSKYKLGDKVPVQITWDAKPDHSGYENKLTKIGECVRKPDLKDEASYEVVQDCEDLVVNGVSVGVHCERTRSPELLTKCPWFRLH